MEGVGTVEVKVVEVVNEEGSERDETLGCRSSIEGHRKKSVVNDEGNVSVYNRKEQTHKRRSQFIFLVFLATMYLLSLYFSLVEVAKGPLMVSGPVLHVLTNNDVVDDDGDNGE